MARLSTDGLAAPPVYTHPVCGLEPLDYLLTLQASGGQMSALAGGGAETGTSSLGCLTMVPPSTR